MDTTIEAAKAFCHHGKSAFAFDPIVLKHMAEFSDAQNARLVSELETKTRAVEEIERLAGPDEIDEPVILGIAQAALKGKE